MGEINHFADTIVRGHKKTPVGIRLGDRKYHVHAIGKTGTGKTTLLETLIREDIDAGRGVALIDPHGDLALRVKTYAENKRPVLYFDAADPDNPYGYNPLRAVSTRYIPLAASGLMQVFKKRFADAWGVRMEHVLRNALYALYDTGGGTLSDILRLLSDKNYRQDLASRIENETVRAFWQSEFPRYSDRYRVDSVAPIQNKVGAFLADPRMRRIVTTPKVDLSLRKLIDQGAVLIINLSKGTVGEDSASLLGAMLLTGLGLAALSRANVPESARRDFFLYVDEFHEFTTLAVADMISELRKYGLSFVLAHQHLHQLEPDVRHAILGNAGTLIAFRVGAEDAALLSKEFMEVVTTEELVGLANYRIYLKLMIDGMPSRPFLAETRTPDRAKDSADGDSRYMNAAFVRSMVVKRLAARTAYSCNRDNWCTRSTA